MPNLTPEQREAAGLEQLAQALDELVNRAYEAQQLRLEHGVDSPAYRAIVQQLEQAVEILPRRRSQQLLMGLLADYGKLLHALVLQVTDA